MKSQRNWLEWTSLVLGSLVSLAVVAYLTHAAITRHSSAPVLVLRLGTPVQAAPGMYQVPLAVDNRGGQTAEAVEVEVSHRPAQGEEQTSQFSVDFIPEGDSAEGWVCFSRDPAAPGTHLEGRILGFKVR